MKHFEALTETGQGVSDDFPWPAFLYQINIGELAPSTSELFRAQHPHQTCIQYGPTQFRRYS